MALLTLHQITKNFSERLLLEQADLTINEGDRIGLIGVNGSGKSTVLRIVAGLEPPNPAPDGGWVSQRGSIRIEYLAQEPPLDDTRTVLQTIFYSASPQMCLLRDYEQAADHLHRHPDDAHWQDRLVTLSGEMDRANGWAAEANAKAILTQLGITDFDASIATLSGGQRKRVALARCLIDRADLLVLDEPTNHIDADTVAWLEEYLASAPGALLLVTHDRYFLDRVVNRIVELDRRQLVSYGGNYRRYLELREERHQRLADVEEDRRRLLRRELEWLRRAPMARGTKQKARIDRVKEMQTIQYDAKSEQVAISLATQRLGKSVLTATGLTKRYGDLTLFENLDFRLEPGDRIGIIGPNGAGKSTLLNILAGQTPPDEGNLTWGETVRLGYYDQRGQDLDDDLRLIEFIENEAPLIHTKDGERVEAAKMLEWFLFDRKMQWGRIGSLSGGERRRLYLLRTLIHRPNVLFLDEPTNDLDIQTLGVLEEFLDHFQGCVVAVSHDRYFLDRTVDFLIHFEEGAASPRYPGPYTTFRRLREEALAASANPTDGGVPLPKSGTSNGSRPPRPRSLSWKEQQELTQLESTIEGWEARKSELTQAINRSGQDYLAMQKLAADLDSLNEQLDTALERWLELTERADG